jgi:hypothetical protein
MTPIPHPTGDAGATNTPDSGPTAAEGIQPVRDALSASSDWEWVEALAALLEPEAFNPDQPAGETWRHVTQQRALGHAATVIMAGYRRVTDDDVERVARAMATKDGWQWDGEYGAAGKPDYWRWAAEAVRALREDT